MNLTTMTPQIDELLLMAIKEDLTTEDLSTNAVFSTPTPASVELLCKQNGILAGQFVFERVFFLLDANIEIKWFVSEGDEIKKGQLLAKLSGNVQNLLIGERSALNYLARMSGIATYTKELVTLLKGTTIKLFDTRKTTPNMRIFEKYAVSVGGGCNHRFNLSDGILLKDNHISAAGGVYNAIAAAKAYAPCIRKIEIEVETLEMVQAALCAGADIIMLDNMSHDMLQQAIALIDKKALIECSGNITKDTISSYIDLDIDYISCGALTHSAPVLDFSMKHMLVKEF